MVGGGDEVNGGLRQTGGTEEGVEDEEKGGGEASRTCSLACFKDVASTVGVTALPSEGTEAAAAGCRRGWVEWMEAGAVLGPASN